MVGVARSVSTRYRDREGSYQQVVALILATIEAKPGNYLVFFPSYQYLTAVVQHFQEQAAGHRVLVQRREMDDRDREAFLADFQREGGQPLVGFAVMGGAFGEGIDLIGDRLIGVVVVGVGLPGLCLERDLIRDHFQHRDGFAYAYQFPGMNRVLQTAGRVIRTEQDRGVVLLIDDRFGQNRYRTLFPNDWEVTHIDRPANWTQALGRFWSREKGNLPTKSQSEPSPE